MPFGPSLKVTLWKTDVFTPFEIFPLSYRSGAPSGAILAGAACIALIEILSMLNEAAA